MILTPRLLGPSWRVLVTVHAHPKKPLRTVLNKVARQPINPVIARPGILNKPAY